MGILPDRDPDLGDLIAIAQATKNTAVKANDTLNRLKNSVNVNSLTQVTRPFTLRSRVYIDDALARADITTDILKTAQSMYAGMILIALQLQNMVSSGVTVGNILGKIATESDKPVLDVLGDLDSLSSSLEVYGDGGSSSRSTSSNNPYGSAGSVGSNADTVRDRRERDARNRAEASAAAARGKTLDPSDPESVQRYKDAERIKRETSVRLDKEFPEDQTPVETALSSKDITVSPPDLLPQGKLIDVTLVGTDAKGNQVPQHVTLAVVIQPFLVKSSAAALILDSGALQSFKERLIQKKAGELRFIKDVIFQADRIKKIENGLKEDKSGGFAQFLAETSKKDKSKIVNLWHAFWQTKGKVLSNNFANSILVITEDAARDAKVRFNADVHSAGMRARFFLNTYVMMIWVVDTSFERVTLYMNGVDEAGEYSYAQLSTKKGGGDTANFVQLLSAMSQNRAPRF